MIRFLLLLLSLPVLALSQGATNDYIFSQKPASGPLVVRPVTPTVGRLLGWPTSINSPAAITLGTGLSLSGSTLNATASSAWADITGTPTTLSGYGITDALAATTAASTYQPLDSDLTSIAALTTTNAGRTVLTAPSSTGTGNIVYATSPTFVTKLTTPEIQASALTGNLLISNQSGTTAMTISGSGSTTNVAFSSATASTIAHFAGGKNLASLPLDTYPSLTELSYVKGVTSAIQTQLTATTNASNITSGSLALARIEQAGATSGQAIAWNGTAWAPTTIASGTNTGDQTITLTGDVTGSGTGSFAATIANDAVTFAKMQEISGTHLVGRHGSGSGNIQEVSVGDGVEFQGSGIRRSALTGDVTASAGSNTTTLATVNSNVGSFGSATAAPAVTVNAKGLVTAVTTNTITPAVGSITGLGTGVSTFLGTPTLANLNTAVSDADLATLGANTFTAVQRLPNGTAAAPALNFGDTTTGIYRNASNEIGFSTNGTLRWNISSGGGLFHTGSNSWFPFPTDGNFYIGGPMQIRQTNGGTNVIRIDAGSSTSTSQYIGWSVSAVVELALYYAAPATLQLGANTATASATAIGQTIKGPNATGATSTGGSLTIAGGTGTSAGGAVIISTAATTTQATAVTVDKDGVTTFAKPPVLPVYTVATLPATAAAGMVQGAQAVVTDATAPTYLGALTGGGAIVCPVFYNGTAWVSH